MQRSTGTTVHRCRRVTRVLVALTALALFATACGDDGGSSDPGSTTSTTGAATDGGSTTTTDAGGGPTTTATDTGDGGGGDGGGAAAPAELQGQLADAGVDCAGYTDTPADRAVPGTDAEGRCEIGDEIVYLYSFDDPAAQDTFVEDGGLFDCTFVSIFGGATVPYVEGDGWVIRPQTEDEAANIADALGGEPGAIECEPVAP